MNLSGKHTACIFKAEGRFYPEDEGSIFMVCILLHITIYIVVLFHIQPLTQQIHNKQINIIVIIFVTYFDAAGSSSGKYS